MPLSCRHGARGWVGNAWRGWVGGRCEADAACFSRQESSSTTPSASASGSGKPQHCDGVCSLGQPRTTATHARLAPTLTVTLKQKTHQPCSKALQHCSPLLPSSPSPSARLSPTHPDCDLEEDLVRPAGRRPPRLHLPLLAIQHRGAVPTLHSKGVAEGEEGDAGHGRWSAGAKSAAQVLSSAPPMSGVATRTVTHFPLTPPVLTFAAAFSSRSSSFASLASRFCSRQVANSARQAGKQANTGQQWQQEGASGGGCGQA